MRELNRYEILLLYTDSEADNGYVTRLLYRGVEIRYYCYFKNTLLAAGHFSPNESRHL